MTDHKQHPVSAHAAKKTNSDVTATNILHKQVKSIFDDKDAQAVHVCVTTHVHHKTMFQYTGTQQNNPTIFNHKFTPDNLGNKAASPTSAAETVLPNRKKTAVTVHILEK